MNESERFMFRNIKFVVYFDHNLSFNVHIKSSKVQLYLECLKLDYDRRLQGGNPIESTACGETAGPKG